MTRVVRNRYADPPPSEAPQSALGVQGSSGAGVLGWLANNWPAVYCKLVAAAENRFARKPDYRDRNYAIKRPTRSGRLP